MSINKSTIQSNVKNALSEDIQNGDITASLIDENASMSATIITREPMVLCGIDWAQECFFQIDPDIDIQTMAHDGDLLVANDCIMQINGRARHILTAERSALNFIQMLSATATSTHQFSQKIASTKCRILDTRKTIPGLRAAQKYAVKTGGGVNHRFGLYDAILIKENHIQACGSITDALKSANRIAPDDMIIEVEVENITQLTEALTAGAKRIMLDNFDINDTINAVKLTRSLDRYVDLEASGNISMDNVLDYAQTGIDFISLGTLTKNIQAIDLSLRYV